MHFVGRRSALVIVTLVTAVQINGEENEWLTASKNAQDSIKDSIAKVKSYGVSDEKVKSATDNAFDDFVKFVKNGLSPTMEKLKTPSDGNTRIRTKLNAWVDGLERLNGASDGRDPFDKFDSTVQTMVNNAPRFAEKIRTASPEHRDTLLEVGGFVKRAIGRLADNMRAVAGKLAGGDAKPADGGRLERAQKTARKNAKQ